MAGEHEWITSLQTVQLLKTAGIDDPKVLATWAENELVRTQAGEMRFDSDSGDRERDFIDPPNIPSRFWHWLLRGNHSVQNWELGLFQAEVGVEYRDQFTMQRVREQWCMVDVTFNAHDLRKRIATSSPRLEPASAERGELPSSAKPTHHRHLEWAHKAAEMVRSGQFTKGRALKIVAREAKEAGLLALESSVERAIRATFDLIYYSDGSVIKNDHK